MVWLSEVGLLSRDQLTRNESMPNSISLPSASCARESFLYKQETGELFWKKALSPRIKVGDVAGCRNKEGYAHVRFGGKLYKAHRLIWLIMTGEDPGLYDIDHINGDRSDNRWVNLRLATNSQNKLNISRHKNNSSGVKGVHWSSERKCWVAQLRLEGKTLWYKRFNNLQDASDAIALFRKELHGEFARQD